MAQTNFTPISLYYSTTAAAVPTAGNLVAGELAINTADGKLFYKDSSNVVQVIGTKGGVGSSTNTQVLYNASGLVAGDADFTFNGTTVTMANDASISGLTVGKGGGAVASNTVVGNLAGANNSTGAQNVYIGQVAGFSATGSNNTIVGYASGYNTTGSNNAGFGHFALYNNTSGATNTAIGVSALSANTTASNNTAVGYLAGTSNTTGASNTAIGQQSLASNTTASNNTAVGYQAGYSNTTGGATAFGQSALRTNTTGLGNVGLGNSAGYSMATNNYSTYVGHFTGYNTTGGGNTFIGNAGSDGSAGCGFYMTTGSNNTIIGGYTGNQAGLDIRTASNYIVLSDGVGNPRQIIDNSGNCSIPGVITSLGVQNNTTGAGANMFISAGTMFRSTSSLKYKTDVQDATHGLAEVMQLRPVTYKGINDGDLVFGGLIAEEVETAGLTEFVQYAEDGTPDALAYGNMVSLCVKAIQELNAKVEAQALEIATLKGN